MIDQYIKDITHLPEVDLDEKNKWFSLDRRFLDESKRIFIKYRFVKYPKDSLISVQIYNAGFEVNYDKKMTKAEILNAFGINI